MAEQTLEERVRALEGWCAFLQQQVDWMKNNPVISFRQDFENTVNYNCKCTSSECYQMNGAWVCSKCNRPLANLPSFTAGGSAGQTGT
jgi:hypothetical protein